MKTEKEIRLILAKHDEYVASKYYSLTDLGFKFCWSERITLLKILGDLQ